MQLNWLISITEPTGGSRGRGCSTDMLDCPLPPENPGSAPGTCKLPQNVKLKITLKVLFIDWQRRL